ncbi:RidA family protein [Frankia sp. CNm7]|uniref:RidA family protein n=2 Tax=Frankia nepalensis TaxID=1836974 RepID=A0A937R8X8_9ACTN|nr:RidA family protein [Frankia nepalensis]MBL7510156.1 RidA family protein [Frankia nepalensis]MBL7518995.1 RidA family protein [Frankia nepalensis]MBL7626060.1 RidA family protein [Frankia nepalensis]
MPLPAGLAGLAPISAAVRVGRLLVLSGCVALDPATGRPRGGTVDSQARDVFRQIAEVLGAAGGRLTDVARCVCYLTDAAAAPELDVVFREAFPTDPPARTTVVCALVRPGLLVEIEATAVLG